MFTTALKASLLFTYLSLPLVLAVVLLAPGSLGYLLIALGMQIMMTAAYSLHGKSEHQEKMNEVLEDISTSYFLLLALLVGGSLQLVVLGIPVLAGIYGGPVIGLGTALAFPFVDGKLNQWFKWLSPSVVMRYLVTRGLILAMEGNTDSFKSLEPRMPLFAWERY
jgi:hypothetical protein